MAKDITEEFCRDPETFMKNNVVMQWIQHEKAEILYLGVKQIEDATISNKPNGKVCYFFLKDKKSAPALPAYWCPYQQNKFKSTMLGNDALFAFTPAVTGCSVGIGSGAEGCQMMSHVNSASVGNDWVSDGQDVAAARQAQSQDAQLRYKLGGDASIISPTAYSLDEQGEKMNATVYGIHGLSQAWSLFSLTYRKTGAKEYYHGGITRYT